MVINVTDKAAKSYKVFKKVILEDPGAAGQNDTRYSGDATPENTASF